MHNVHPTPKISVITVCRNAQQVIEDTIQSVISQTYHNLEYIIIDGQSTDNTLQLVKKYQSRITVLISEPDKGIYDAMNKGLDAATGDYVCFMNAGDCFHEDDTLTLLVHTLILGKPLPDVIYGQTEIVNKDRHFLRMRRLSAPEQLTWKSFKKGMLVCHQAFFASRKLTEHYDLSYHFSADFDWCIKVMKKSKYLHYTNLTLVDYLAEGTTTQNHNASLKERFHIMCHHYGYISTIIHHIWFVIRLIIHK